jgi:hypothetical protein
VIFTLARFWLEFLLLKWCSRPELNRDLPLRRRQLYPFELQERGSRDSNRIAVETGMTSKSAHCWITRRSEIARSLGISGLAFVLLAIDPEAGEGKLYGAPGRT